MTAEIAPPVSADAQELRSKAAPLKGLADAVNVTDGAGARAHMAALAAASILIGMGIEPILQITCRDKNRIALQSELMGAAALGVRNLLLLTGDDPKAGDQPDTKPVFDINSSTLIETARRLRDEGTLPTGRKVAGHAAFFIGAADMPIDPPAGWQPNALLGKIKSGAQFAQTQFCMDAAIVRRYVGALEAAGVTKQLAILIGVNPLRSAKSAQWMKSHLFGTIIADALIARMEEAADPSREGIAHLRRIDRGIFDHSRRRRRPHHGAGQRRGDPGGHRRGKVARSKRRSLTQPTIRSAYRGALSPCGRGQLRVPARRMGEGLGRKTPHPAEFVARPAMPSPARGNARSAAISGSRLLPRANIDFRFQRAVHRAFVGDFEKPRALFRGQVAFKRDRALDVVDLALFGFAFGAILGVDFFVAQANLRAQKRNLLEIGIEPHRHRGAGAERREQKIIGARPSVEAAVLDRLVGQQAMFAEDDLLLKLAAPRFPHRDGAGRCISRELGIDRHIEIAIGPGRDDARHVDGVACAADEMVGAGERNETFRMFCREKDLAGIVDADGVVGRRMKHQQRLVQARR